MKLIKIDRSSIKENPNKGNTSSIVQTGSERWQFEIEGKLPYFLHDGLECHVNTWEEGKYYEGDLISQEVFDFVTNKMKDYTKFYGGKMTLKHDKGLERIHHDPIPKYSFNYEETSLQCDNCKQMISLKQIKTIYDDFGDSCYEECPNCKAADSFESIEFEKIEEAIKES